MRLTKQQSDACQALLDALPRDWRSSDDAKESATNPPDPSVEGEGDPAYDDQLDDSDDEEYENGRSSIEDDVPLASGADPGAKITENQIQASLLELLLSMYTQLPRGAEDKFWSPILRFIVLSSVKKNGRWLSSREITQTFAALLFCGRLLMMVLMYRKVLSNPQVRYSE
jgi:hypothetical protein